MTLATSARAEEPAADADEAAEGPQVRLGARVFTRADADERDQYQRHFSIPSARMEVRARLAPAQLVVKADLADGTIVKDAYIRLQAREGTLRLYGGRFKSPFSARALESAWDLPLVERGLVHDYVVDTHQLGGRRIGLMGEAKLPSAKLVASAGVFEGARDDRGRLGEDAAARVRAKVARWLSVGGGAYLADLGNLGKRFAGSTNVVLRAAPLRAVLEGTAGRLLLGDFLAQTALVSVRLQPGEDWMLDPFLSAEALQLRGPRAGRGYAGAAGVSVTFADRVKLWTAFERALRPGDAGPGNRVWLQLGSRF